MFSETDACRSSVPAPTRLPCCCWHRSEWCRCLAVGLAYQIVGSPYVTEQNVTRNQPVPFSHEHHVGGLGLDCRYCHTSVEKARFAGLPPTETCMTCHSQIWTNARDAGAGARKPRREQADPLAARAPASRTTSTSIIRFMSPKASAARPATAPIEQMKLTRQAAPLTMQWCLDCHRDPAKIIAPARSRCSIPALETAGQPAKSRGASCRRLSHSHRPPDGLLDMSPLNELPVEGSRFFKPRPDALNRRQALSLLATGYRDRSCGLQQAHRRDHSLCNAARTPGTRRSAEIRHNAFAFGLWPRRHRHLNRWPTDQGRGQSAASGKPRRDRRFCRGRSFVAL